MRKTGSSLAKLREVTPVFLILEEVYIKMRVFIKTERILRKTGRSLDKHRSLFENERSFRKTWRIKRQFERSYDSTREF